MVNSSVAGGAGIKVHGACTLLYIYGYQPDSSKGSLKQQASKNAFSTVTNIAVLRFEAAFRPQCLRNHEMSQMDAHHDVSSVNALSGDITRNRS